MLSNDTLDLSFSDMMKLLNLRAIASLEFKMNLPNNSSTECSMHNIKRSAANQKFADKINETLASLIGTSVRRASQSAYNICEASADAALPAAFLGKSQNC